MTQLDTSSLHIAVRQGERGERQRPSRGRSPSAPAAASAAPGLMGACSQFRQRRMEPLWSPVVATGGKWRGREDRSNRRKPLRGCDQLPESFHGKEGVDGSSPSEGSAKAPHDAAFFSDQLQILERAAGMEPFTGAFRSRVTKGTESPFQARPIASRSSSLID
jgi:hypothetical protein